MTSQSDQVHCGEAGRWGGWFWREPVRGEHFRRCSYCGSIHPDDLAVEPEWSPNWADMKYGFPHKFYVDMPNRDPERLFAIGGTSRFREEHRGRYIPFEELTDDQRAICERDRWPVEPGQGVYIGPRPYHPGKFYTAHLADPAIADEVREQIMARSGLRFTFTEDGRVSWSQYGAPE